MAKVSFGQNLIPNGNFETGTLSPWYGSGKVSAAARAHSGSYCGGNELFQNINVQTGNQYTLTGWIWARNSLPVTFGVKDANGNVIDQATSTTDSYVEKTIVFTATTSTITIFFNKTSGTGDVHIDDVVLTGQSAPVTYTLTVNNGTGDGVYTAGTVINVSATVPSGCYNFVNWTGSTAGLASTTNANTTFTMPAANATITANSALKQNTLTVNSGSGDGSYTEGQVVTITADAAPAGQVFDTWTGSVANVANVGSATTTVTMPCANISLTATYKTIPVSGDNLIVNGGFETGIMSPWFGGGKVSAASRAHSGSYCGGNELSQQVSVQIGAQYTLKGWIWARNSLPVAFGVKDANGNVIDQATSTTDAYVEKTIVFTANTSTVTVFFNKTSGTGDVHIDDVTLNGAGTTPPACTLTLSKTSHNFSSTAGSTTASVTTTEAFTVSDNQAWITTSVSGSTITINVTENTGTSSRSGVVTVTGCETKTISITQEGSTPPACTLTLSKTSHNFSSAAGSTTASATTTEAFTVSDNQSWITTSVSGSTITINATANTGTSSRSGVVTVTGCETKTINISQSGVSAGGYPNDGSPLGTNLVAHVSYTGDFAFKDLTVKAREWVDIVSGAGISASNLTADNYPKGGITAKVFILTSGGAPDFKGGDWVLLYQGDGDLSISVGANSEVSRQAGRIVYNMKANTQVQISITRNSSSNPVHDIHFVPLQYENDFRSQPFVPEWLALWEKFKCIRFMDWMETNGSSAVEFSDLDTDNRFGFNKTPVSMMVKLANTLHADAWFCFPHQCSDNFVTQFATYIKNNLNTDLKAYYEYSNEIWNSTFSQTQYANNKGIALNLDTDQYKAGAKYKALRSVQIFDIIEGVYGSQTSSRVVRVLAEKSQTPSRTGYMIEQLNEMGRNNVDALAIAPYFGGNGIDGGASNIKQVLIDDITNNRFPNVAGHKTYANQMGWSLVGYEGGQHIQVNALNINRSNDMYDIYYNTYLPLVAQYFDGIFCSFTSISQCADNSCFGTLNDVDDVNSPKYKALIDWIDVAQAGLKSANVSLNKDIIESEDNYSVYPNPCNGQFTVSSQTTIGLDVKVFDLAGKLVIRKTSSDNSMDVSTSGLKAGMYILSVNDEHSKLLVK